MSLTVILGSSGFIGSNLVQYLQQNKLNGLCSAGRYDCEIDIDLESGEWDLKNIPKGSTFVFLSSISAPSICDGSPELARKVNVESTIKLIEELIDKGVKVIFSSSDVVLGETTKPKGDCSDPDPMGNYGQMKFEVENRFLKEPNFKVIRFSYVLGKGDKFTSMLDEFADKGEIVDIFDGFNRSIVGLQDVMKGIESLINDWAVFEDKVFNFVGPELVSRLKLAEMYKLLVNPNLEFSSSVAPDEFWLSRPKTINAVSSNFERLLGKKPNTILEILEGWNND